MGVEGVKNKKTSGVNLSKLGLGVGKILNKKVLARSKLILKVLPVVPVGVWVLVEEL